MNIALNLLKEPPFRFDIYLRKISRNIDKNYEYFLLYLDKNIKVMTRDSL
jgi:hypothetical protein